MATLKFSVGKGGVNHHGDVMNLQEFLNGVPPQNQAEITGKKFFPGLISDPFIDGLRITFTFSAVLFLLAAWAAWKSGTKKASTEEGTIAASESLEEALL